MDERQPIRIPGTVLSGTDLYAIAAIQPEDIEAVSSAWKRRNSGRYENLIDAPVVQTEKI